MGRRFIEVHNNRGPLFINLDWVLFVQRRPEPGDGRAVIVTTPDDIDGDAVVWEVTESYDDICLRIHDAERLGVVSVAKYTD